MWEDTFDRAAPDYDAPELWFLDDAAAALAEAVGIETGERVLDVATGTGKLAAAATEGVGRAVSWWASTSLGACCGRRVGTWRTRERRSCRAMRPRSRCVTARSISR